MHMLMVVHVHCACEHGPRLWRSNSNQPHAISDNMTECGLCHSCRMWLTEIIWASWKHRQMNGLHSKCCGRLKISQTITTIPKWKVRNLFASDAINIQIKAILLSVIWKSENLKNVVFSFWNWFIFENWCNDAKKYSNNQTENHICTIAWNYSSFTRRCVPHLFK